MYDGFMPIKIGDVYRLSSYHITDGKHFATIDKVSGKYPLKIGFSNWDIRNNFIDYSELIDKKIDIIINK